MLAAMTIRRGGGVVCECVGKLKQTSTTQANILFMYMGFSFGAQLDHIRPLLDEVSTTTR
jgi:hypothetical protein